MVRNEDIPKLRRVWYIMHDAELLERRMMWQRDRMVRITQQYSDMPHGGAPKGMDEIFAMLDELESEQRKALEEYAEAFREADRIIRAVPDHELRTFVNMAYLEQASAAQIRRTMRIGEKKLRYMRECVEMAERMADVKFPKSDKRE